MKNLLLSTLLFISVIANAQYPVLYNFKNYEGTGSLSLSGKILYGTTRSSVFSIDTNGNGYKIVVDSVFPTGSILSAGSKLYGTTNGGGSFDIGSLFSVDTCGSNYTKLFDFSKESGYFPNGSLVISGNMLYGMNFMGGKNDAGNVFSVDTNGNGYKVILDFDTIDGKNPQGSLILYNNKLYGTTTYGVGNVGIIFSIDKNGSDYKKIFSFNGENGSNPMEPLMIKGSTIYGVAFLGGASNKGVIFSLDTSGNNYKILHSFKDIDGSLPTGRLIIEGNKLYGMTREGGGIWPYGCIFSMSTNGDDYKILLHFNSVNGFDPCGSLTYLLGNLYGVARNVIFKYMQLHDSIISTSNKCFGESSGSACVIALGGDAASGYSYHWTPGDETTPVITNLATGKYIVTIKDIVNNNTIIDSVMITEPSAPLLVNVLTTLSSCDSSGSADVNVSGGVPPYKYFWNPTVKADSIATGLVSGYYKCVITDSLRCNKSVFFSIKDTGSFKATRITSSDLKCFNDSNGIAIASIKGGVKPYTFFWSPYGGNDTIAQNLKANTYYFSALDSKGCKADTFIVIAQPSPMTIIPNLLNPDNGRCKGSASVEVSGGSSPYIYSWSNGFASESVYNLCSGQYCCTITDFNGCIDSGACITIPFYSEISHFNDKNKTVWVYPNPFSSQAILQTDNIFNNATMTIFNSIGQQVKQITHFSGHTFTLNRDNLPTGVYILQIKQNNKILMVDKLVITDK